MSVETEELVDLGLVLEDEVPCVVEGCTQEAEWVYDSACCGFQVTVCDYHKKVLDEGWVLVVLTGYICYGCGERLMLPPTWRKL